MKTQSIVDHGQPLQAVEKETPQPSGTEVLMKVGHCGVCHSDVHLQDGYFDLGGGKQLDITGAHSLPFVLGHEIEGEVLATGPDSAGVSAGDRRVVYPWLGCGQCATCARGDEHLCNKPAALGVNVDGGYADHVLVPHSRYLLEYGGIDADLAATYMCSGLTAFSALKKVGDLGGGDTLAIVGVGGVGFMGLQFARALFPEATLIAADISDPTLEAARAAGADRTYNSAEKGAWKQAIKDSGGGVTAAVDFVGAESSLDFAQRIVAKGGKAVVVGLFGGHFELPIPMFPLRELTIAGSYVGSLANAREMLELVRGGRVSPIPLQRRPLEQAEQTLDDLRNGRIVGRVVLHRRE